MSLIEKIDAMIRECHRPGGCSVLHESINSEKAKVLREVKRLILSEQKEPCELCNWFKGMKASIPEIESELGEEIIYKSKKINCCPNCGRQLNQPYME